MVNTLGSEPGTPSSLPPSLCWRTHDHRPYPDLDSLLAASTRRPTTSRRGLAEHCGRIAARLRTTLRGRQWRWTRRTRVRARFGMCRHLRRDLEERGLDHVWQASGSHERSGGDGSGFRRSCGAWQEGAGRGFRGGAVTSAAPPRGAPSHNRPAPAITRTRPIVAVSSPSLHLWVPV